MTGFIDLYEFGKTCLFSVRFHESLKQQKRCVARREIYAGAYLGRKSGRSDAFRWCVLRSEEMGSVGDSVELLPVMMIMDIWPDPRIWRRKGEMTNDPGVEDLSPKESQHIMWEQCGFAVLSYLATKQMKFHIVVELRGSS